MTEAIIAIIVALISYFGSKKAGADDTKAAAIGLAAGAGTYWVAKETDWGKSTVSDIDKWWDQTFDDGVGGKVVDPKTGTEIKGPPGSTLVRNKDGSIARDDAGNPIFELAGKFVSAGGEVLKSWGPTGTAAVIGAAGVASGKIPQWMVLAGLGIAAIVLLK